jgi:hypothetical protein
MGNAELLALLREARDRLALHMETYFSQQKGTMFLTIGLVERIDAALAAREAEENVEVRWSPSMDGGYIFDNGATELRLWPWGDKWCWDATVNGECNTLDEAQRAALAAARGMR